MATITALTEDFDGAAAGQNATTSNTSFTAITGTGGTSVFNADEFDTGFPSMEVTATSTVRSHNTTHTAAAGWRGFGMKVLATPTGSDTVCAWYTSGGTVHGGDVRVLTDLTMQLRNKNSSADWTSTGTAISLNTWYWVSVQVDSNNARLKVYNISTMLFDSGARTVNYDAGTPDQFRLGTQQIAAVPTSTRFARMRGDDTTEIPSGWSGGPGIAVYTQSTRTLVDASGSTGTVTLTQTSGPTATSITGPSSGVFTVVHPAGLSANMVFDLDATQNSVTDTEVVTITAGGGARSTLVYDTGVWT